MIVFTAASGAPGVTTTALALAASWPRDRLLVEADPKGGDLRLRQGLKKEPSTATLAAGLLGPLDASDLASHAQELRDGTRLIIGPSSPAEAEAALRALAPCLPLDGGPDLLVDCGRYTSGDGVRSLVSTASLVVVVIGQERLAPHDAACAIDHAAHLVERLRGTAHAVAAVVVGRQPYAPDEVSKKIAAEVLAVLPRDHQGIEVLGSTPRTPREKSAAKRSALLRESPAAARHVADALDLAARPHASRDDFRKADSR